MKKYLLLSLLTVISAHLTPKSLAAGDIGAIVIDVQGCFTQLKNGSLAVPDSDQKYVTLVNNATKYLFNKGVKIYATQDWHPKNHMSFYTNHLGKNPFDVIALDPAQGLKKQNQVLWPPHCEQDSDSAQLLVGMDSNLFTYVQKKGTNPAYDSYSGFEDDNSTPTGLEARLKADNIKKLIVYGIATDYCVKDTAIDAKKAGFDVVFVKRLSRGVAPETTKAAIAEMKKSGVKVVNAIIEPRGLDELFNRVS